MTKKELNREVAYKLGIVEVDASIALEAFITVIKENVKKGNPVTLRGFGEFGIKHRKQKIGQNIGKKTPIVIPAKDIPFFKVYDTF